MPVGVNEWGRGERGKERTGAYGYAGWFNECVLHHDEQALEGVVVHGLEDPLEILQAGEEVRVREVGVFYRLWVLLQAYCKDHLHLEGLERIRGALVHIGHLLHECRLVQNRKHIQRCPSAISSYPHHMTQTQLTLLTKVRDQLLAKHPRRQLRIWCRVQPQIRQRRMVVTGRR